MAARVSAGLTPSEGRRFAFTLAVAFGAFGGVLAWRGHTIPTAATLALAALLAVAGLVVPGRLGPVHAGWMRLALAISRVTSPVFLAITYFGAFLPVGLARRALGRDPLRPHRPGVSAWVSRPAGQRKSDLTRQF